MSIVACYWPKHSTNRLRPAWLTGFDLFVVQGADMAKDRPSGCHCG